MIGTLRTAVGLSDGGGFWLDLAIELLERPQGGKAASPFQNLRRETAHMQSKV